MVRVKVCGITREADALAAAQAGADAVGFVFTRQSTRYVSPDQAGKICQALPVFVSKVGVFVDEEVDKVCAVAQMCGLEAVQLHGDESPSFCVQLKSRGFKIIKAFRVKDDFDVAVASSYSVDAFLFDAYNARQHGGTGSTFSWDILRGFKTSIPVIVSGGLTVDNVRRAIDTLNPYAVDVSSGVEISPGIKDVVKVVAFLQETRSVL